MNAMDTRLPAIRLPDPPSALGFRLSAFGFRLSALGSRISAFGFVWPHVWCKFPRPTMVLIRAPPSRDPIGRREPKAARPKLDHVILFCCYAGDSSAEDIRRLYRRLGRGRRHGGKSAVRSRGRRGDDRGGPDVGRRKRLEDVGLGL